MNRKQLDLMKLAAALAVVGAPDGSPPPPPTVTGSDTRHVKRKPPTVAKESRQLRRAMARAERKRAAHREAA